MRYIVYRVANHYGERVNEPFSLNLDINVAYRSVEANMDADRRWYGFSQARYEVREQQ